MQGYPPALRSPVPIYTPGWREALWEYSVSPKNTTQCPRPGLEPGPIARESSALTMRAPHLPKPYKLLKFFISFVTTVKSCHAQSICKEMRWKSLCLLILKSITEIIKYFKSLYHFGGRCLKIKDICIDFEPYFKVHNLVSGYPKSIILGQMTNLNMIFHVVMSVYRLVKIWNSQVHASRLKNHFKETILYFIG